jgi:hypothetical protein
MGIDPHLRARMHIMIETMSGLEPIGVNSVDAIQELTQATSSRTLVVSNCAELSPKAAFDVVQILKLWTSPSQAQNRTIRNALAMLRMLSARINALDPQGRMEPISASFMESTFHTAVRGIELIRKLGFRLKKSLQSANHRQGHASCTCQYVLRKRGQDRAVFRLIATLLNDANRRPHETHSHSILPQQMNADERLARELQRRFLLEDGLELPVEDVAPSFQFQSRPTSIPLARPQRRRRRVPIRRVIINQSRSSVPEDHSPGLPRSISSHLPAYSLGIKDINLIPHDEQECGICLSEFSQGDEVIRLPCMHLYHNACILQWFERSKCCPMDRTEVNLSPSIENLGTAAVTA